MKLFSAKLEHVAIRSICSSGSHISSYLLGTLDASFFHHEPTAAAFYRLSSVAKKRSIILSYTELLEDQTLNEEFRDLLSNSKVVKVGKLSVAKRLIGELDKYRKARQVYQMAKTLIEKLKMPSVEIDKLLDFASGSLAECRSREDITKLVHSLGKDGDALDLVDEALSVEDEVLLKTGFKEIDDKNGGVPSEGVMILAATTSGGKSTMLMNLLMNMYRINKISVSNVSLEMNERKLTRRMLSRITRIPYWKFVKRCLSEDEREQSKKAWIKFHKFGVKYDCQFSMICPTHSMGITQLLTLLKPYGHKVIGIDYISLLEGVDEKDQWRTLSAIAREAKIFSAENKCLVILLAQLDSDDDRIRYSKGVLEHADAAWTWNYAKAEVRETKTIPVRQLKARDQDLYGFELREDFATMAILNMDDAEAGPSQTTSESDVDLNNDPELSYDAGQT